MSDYNDAFYASINAGSVRSARALLPMVVDLLPIGSVVDFGCGQGAWLQVWSELGVVDVVGVDGTYVDRSEMRFPTERFVPGDLVSGLELGRRFDLVQSLEVAEHLPESSADVFVDTLVRHGDVVMFSAAVPGQGGTQHINEKPRAWWREIFASRGFVAVDPFRDRLATNPAVMPWYRYNTLLFVNEQRLADLPGLVPYLVPPDEPIRDLSPMLYKLRKVVLAQMPVRFIDRLARLRILWLARPKGS